MSARIVTLLLGVTFLGAGASEAQEAAQGWAILTRADVQAIHDVLAADHPGPVDPLNPTYGQRLKTGYEAAMVRAGGATSYGDYIRTLRAFTNGFQDGHITLATEVSPSSRWPRFAVAPVADGARVTEADAASGMTVGSVILACDGQSIDALMADRIDPYWWNAGIPHERAIHTPRLFLSAIGDQRREFKTCRVRAPDGQEKDTPLTWTGLDSAKARVLASGDVSTHALGLRQVDDVWIVSLPSFQYTTEQVAEATRLVEELTARSNDLTGATVVFDVRGNRGGNSVWGARVARAIWGDELVNFVDDGFDNTVDYRVSTANLAALDLNIARFQRDGLDAAAQSSQRIRDAMAAALARGDPYLNIPSPPGRAADAPMPASPFRGRAYLLTDNACASACLDFADIMRRLPGVTHVGGNTSGDAIYIDNTRAPLPSGLTSLSYSLKVYRNRVRGNNEWYEPQVRGPATPMTTDAELVAWIKSLAA